MVLGRESVLLKPFPIFLELGNEDQKPGAPFKYNHSWSNEEEFCNLIHNIYQQFQRHCGDLASIQFSYALQGIKEQVEVCLDERKKIRL